MTLQNWRSKFALVVAGLLLAATVQTAAPAITRTDDDKENWPTFHITFDKYAVTVSTIFRRVDDTKDPDFADGHYAPKHVWITADSITSIDENFAFINHADADWDVFVQVQYETKPGELSTVESNTLRVHY